MAKLVEVGRNIAVPSLDEGSCDDDLPDQAPKLVKFINRTEVLSLDEGWKAEVEQLVDGPE